MFLSVSVVTVAKAPRGIPVTTSEGPVSAVGLVHITLLRDHWRLGRKQVVRASKCRAGVQVRRRRHFLLEEGEEAIAAAGA